MPTTLHTVAEDNISVRYEAPLLSRDINQKIVAAMPHGIYRGFKLGTSTSVLTVDVEVDPIHNDSMAVIETLDGIGISVKISGAIPLDLSAYTTKTVVIAMFGEYTVGSDTTAVIRAYELSPTDEFTIASEHDELVVLGTVVVPASGLIALTSITPQYRTSSWDFEAPERLQWIPLLKDPMFLTAEDGMTAGRDRYWRLTESAGTGAVEFTLGGGTPVYGENSLLLNVSAGPYTAYAYQDVDVPVTPGQYYYIRCYFRESFGITAGAVGIKLTFDNEDMSSQTTVTHTIDFTALAAGWNNLMYGGQVAASGAHFLRRIQIDLNAVTGGPNIGYIDALQVFLEAKPADFQLNAGTLLDRVCADRILMVPGALASSLSGNGLVLDNVSSVLELQAQNTGLKDKGLAVGKILLGEDLLSSAGLAVIPRVTADANTNTKYTLLWESTVDGVTPLMRIYVDYDGQLTITYNARWEYVGADAWYEDTAGDEAHKYTFSGTGLDSYVMTAGAGNWLDTAWTENTLELPGLISDLGSHLLGTDANAALPRIAAAIRAATYTLLWESTWGTNNPGLRLYSYQGSFTITHNAAWDATGTQWVSDDLGGNDAWKYVFDDQGLTTYVRASPPANWADTAWDSPEYLSMRGQLELGLALRASDAEAAIARLVMQGRSGTYTLLIESRVASGDIARVYVDDRGGLTITHNANWDGTQWTSDDTGGDNATKFTFGADGLDAWIRESPPASWADSAWDSPAQLRTNNQVEVGDNLWASAADAAIARLFLRTRSGDYTLLLQTSVNPSTPQMYLYKGDDETFVVTYNAEWTGTLWSANSTGSGAHKYTFSEDGLNTEYKDAGTATWADGAWDGVGMSWSHPLDLDIKGIIDIGESMNTTAAQARDARIDMPFAGATPGATLLLRSTTPTGSSATWRLYRDETGNQPEMWLTSNALINTTPAFDDDTTSRNSYGVSIYEDTWTWYVHASAGVPWTTWNGVDGDGLQLKSTGVRVGDDLYALYWADATVDNANPSRGNALADNVCTAKHVPKAWGHIVFSAGAITSQSGVNYTASIVSGDLVLTWTRPLITEAGSISYPIFTSISNVGWSAQRFGFTLTTSTIRVYDASQVYQDITVTSYGGQIDFVIFGCQGTSG